METADDGPDPADPDPALTRPYSDPGGRVGAGSAYQCRQGRLRGRTGALSRLTDQVNNRKTTLSVQQKMQIEIIFIVRSKAVSYIAFNLI